MNGPEYFKRAIYLTIVTLHDENRFHIDSQYSLKSGIKECQV
jgi:hypothetical protein